MNAVVIGGNGQLGQQFSTDYQLASFDLPVIDITDPLTFRLIKQQRPDVVINCAAYTAVDLAENDQKTAMAVNVLGCANLAALAKELDATLVHISTDYVFDGTSNVPYTEESQTAPINFYGQTKLEGEQAIINSGVKHLIVRTAWLYGKTGPNFVLSMLKLAQEKSELKVVTDQVGSPTWTHDLAAAVMALLHQKQTGIFNIVNTGSASKYELVKEICNIANLSPALTSATSADFPTPAKRPHYSVLSTTKLEKFFPMPDWRTALRSYLKEVIDSQ